MAPIKPSGMVDPGWEHGIAQDEKKKKVKCNYCGKVVSGGIYRLKQHLARVSGEVTYCDKAPEEVYIKMKAKLEGSCYNKKLKQSDYDGQVFLTHYEEEEGQAGYRSKRKQQLIEDRSMVVSLAPVRSLGYVDPGWEHGVAQDERKKKVKCNYCDKVVSGGINRFKQHLARIPGEVAPCKNVPDEVFLKIKENMKWHRTGRRQRLPDTKEIYAIQKHSDNDEEEDEHEQDEFLHLSQEMLTIGNERLQKDLKVTLKGVTPMNVSEPLFKKSRLDSLFLNTTNGQVLPSSRQLKVKNDSNQKSRKDVISAICRFFYHAGVPLEAANSMHFRKMLEMVGQYGPDLVGPRSHMISGRFLQEEISTIRNYLDEYKASWAITGCSILADSWKSIEGRTLINILVSCPRGIYFLKSVDASDIVEDSISLFKLLDKVVEDMGEENVVQVITEDTPSYKAAGKMLEERRRHLFWTPCATYCIERVFEDFLKIKSVAKCMVKSQKITKFIYNSTWLVNLMKEFTQGQEILRPAATRYASSFATLQTLLDHRICLRQMFQSNKWVSSRFSKLNEGKEVEKIVLNATFWKKVLYVAEAVDPVMQVHQMVYSGEFLSMPRIYNDMDKAKLAIKSIHDDDADKYGPFWSVMDKHCNALLCHPLYMAAFFLNPSYRYRPDFLPVGDKLRSEVVRGLNDCILRLEPDNLRRICASRQIPDYNSAKGDFGTELAISTRTELDPASWWQQHGISCLELQKIAVCILSQTCSSLGCEHSWSIYDQIHAQWENRLAQKKLDDLIFVHYNLRLREGQLRKRSDSQMLLDDVILERLLNDWTIKAEKHELHEQEETSYDENGMYDDGCCHTLEYNDGTTADQKSLVEPDNTVEIEALEVIRNNSDVVSSEDNDDENFLKDDMSD